MRLAEGRELAPRQHPGPVPDAPARARRRTAAKPARSLATIPVVFVPGRTPPSSERPPSPTRRSCSRSRGSPRSARSRPSGGVLSAALSLGDRRGRFVSAVTHELRTPLTTFRMYSQMLADGMVAGVARAEYLATLRDESERLIARRRERAPLLAPRGRTGRGAPREDRCRALIDRILPRSASAPPTEAWRSRPIIEVDPAKPSSTSTSRRSSRSSSTSSTTRASTRRRPTTGSSSGFRTTARLLEVALPRLGPGIPEPEREAVFLPFRRGAPATKRARPLASASGSRSPADSHERSAAISCSIRDRAPAPRDSTIIDLIRSLRTLARTARGPRNILRPERPSRYREQIGPYRIVRQLGRGGQAPSTSPRTRGSDARSRSRC